MKKWWQRKWKVLPRIRRRSNGCYCRLLIVSAHLITLYLLFKEFVRMEVWHLPHHPHLLDSWTAYLTQLRIFSIQGIDFFTFKRGSSERETLWQYRQGFVTPNVLGNVKRPFDFLLRYNDAEMPSPYNQGLNSIPKNLKEHFLAARK